MAKKIHPATRIKAAVAQILGTGRVGHGPTGAGVLLASLAALAGTGRLGHAGTGAVAAGAATVDGEVASGVTGGFTAQPGFSVSGTGAFDGVLTISNASDPFGTGPIFFAFDDGRNAGTALTAVPNNQPTVSGSGLWKQYNGSAALSVLWGPAGSNASGTGKAFRILNNERAGGSLFGRKLQMNLNGSYTGFYLFYNECWNPSQSNTSGAWDGGDHEGGGGGYYKHDWFLANANVYGNQYFDMIPCVFNSQAAQNQVISSASYDAGTQLATVVIGTAAKPATCIYPVGTVYNCPMGVATSDNTCTACAPSTWNAKWTGCTVTAIGGNGYTITIPMATDPGTMTTKGGVNAPGASGTGLKSPPTFGSMGGNSSNGPETGTGLPSARTVVGGGPQAYDTSVGGWNSKEFGYCGDATSPTTNPGTRYSSLYNVPNKQAFVDVNQSAVLFSSVSTYQSQAANFANFGTYQMNGLLQEVGTWCIDRSDFFLQLGPYAMCRFMIHDGATLATSSAVQPCEPTSWAAGDVDIKLRQGRFTSLSGLYLSYFDQNNTQHLVGRFS